MCRPSPTLVEGGEEDIGLGKTQKKQPCLEIVKTQFSKAQQELLDSRRVRVIEYPHRFGMIETAPVSQAKCLPK